MWCLPAEHQCGQAFAVLLNDACEVIVQAALKQEVGHGRGEALDRGGQLGRPNLFAKCEGTLRGRAQPFRNVLNILDGGGDGHVAHRCHWELHKSCQNVSWSPCGIVGIPYSNLTYEMSDPRIMLPHQCVPGLGTDDCVSWQLYLIFAFSWRMSYLAHGQESPNHLDATHHAALKGGAPALIQQVHLIYEHQRDLQALQNGVSASRHSFAIISMCPSRS